MLAAAIMMMRRVMMEVNCRSRLRQMGFLWNGEEGEKGGRALT